MKARRAAEAFLERDESWWRARGYVPETTGMRAVTRMRSMAALHLARLGELTEGEVERLHAIVATGHTDVIDPQSARRILDLAASL